MMTFDVDVNTFNSDGTADYLIPHGEYLLQIADVVPAESKKGYVQLKFRFDLQELPADWDYNTRVYNTITLIPKGEKGHGIAVHFFKELGLKPDDNGVMTFDLEDFMGLKVIGTVYQEKGIDGNTYNRVKDFKFYNGDNQPHGQDEGQEYTAAEDVPF